MTLSQANAGAIVRNVLDLLDLAKDSDGITDEDWMAAIKLLEETTAHRDNMQHDAALVLIDWLRKIRKS